MSEIGIFEAVVLGLVEGLTEFIPVSSTGHLILAANLLGAHGEKVKVFEIFIQFGAILAVGLIYFKKLFGLIRPNSNGGFQGLNGLICLILGCLPAIVLALLFASKIKELLFAPIPVGIALIVGALLMIVVEKRQTPVKIDSLDQLTPKICLIIGLVQSLSLWPGMSRAATSIVGGIAVGVSRKIAAEFSFLMAVPLITAAAAYDIFKNMHLLATEDISIFVIGSVVAFLSAYVAVKGFISLLSRISLLPFAYYRLAVGAAVLIYFM